MKITRRQLRTIIESALFEDKALSSEEANELQSALSSYIEKGAFGLNDKAALGGMLASFGAGGAGFAAEAAAFSNPFALAIASGALIGGGAGTLLDNVFAINTKTFKNQVIRRAALNAGLEDEVGRYSQPGQEEIIRKGGTVHPRKQDSAFNRQIGLLLMLSKVSRGEKPRLVVQYEQMVDAGLIDEKAYEEFAKKESKAIKQAFDDSK